MKTSYYELHDRFVRSVEYERQIEEFNNSVEDEKAQKPQLIAKDQIKNASKIFDRLKKLQETWFSSIE
jgi:hypothetical protein